MEKITATEQTKRYDFKVFLSDVPHHKTQISHSCLWRILFAVTYCCGVYLFQCRYMTWDKNKFPTPDQMQKNLASKGRKVKTSTNSYQKFERRDLETLSSTDAVYNRSSWARMSQGHAFFFTAKMKITRILQHSFWLTF